MGALFGFRRGERLPTRTPARRKSRTHREAPRPTAEYIRALASTLERYYAEENTAIADERAVRAMTKPVSIPDELRLIDLEIRDPSSNEEYLRTVATFCTNPPTCQVSTTGTGDLATDLAEELEDATEEILWAAGSMEPGVNTWRYVTGGCLGDGAGWSKLVMVSDQWTDERGPYDLEYDEYVKDGKGGKEYLKDREEAKRHAGPCFAWVPVDVLTVYPVWIGRQIAEVLEITERPLLELYHTYGVSINDEGRLYDTAGAPLSPGEAHRVASATVKVYEHWTHKYVTMCVEDAEKPYDLEQWEHGYGRHPYVPALGPSLSAGWHGRKSGWSPGKSKQFFTELKSTLYTLAVQDMAREVGKPVVLRESTPAQSIIGTNNMPKTEEPIPWGGVKVIGKDDEILAWPSEPITPALQQMLAYVDGLASQVSSPRVADNLGSGDESGFAVNTRISEAKTRYAEYKAALEESLTDTTELLWHLIRDVVGETVYVRHAAKGEADERPRTRWLKIDPEKHLKGDLSVSWEIKLELPSAELIRLRFWEEAVKAGFAFTDQAIEDMGWSPTQVRRGRMVDLMRQDPGYIALAKQEILQPLGSGDLLKQASLAFQQTGAVPGEQMPSGLAAMGQAPQGAIAPGGMPGDAAALTVAPNGSIGGVGPGAVNPQAGAGAGLMGLGR